jgi:ketosteroid isomerase-like protein
MSDEDEVTQCSDRYESALRRHDVAALGAAFSTDPSVVRFGIADIQTSGAEVAAWRAQAPPIDPDRRTTFRRVGALAPGVVAVDLTFRDSDGTSGRQSQTWVRGADGWRIVRAHVSVLAEPAGGGR